MIEPNPWPKVGSFWFHGVDQCGSTPRVWGTRGGGSPCVGIHQGWPFAILNTTILKSIRWDLCSSRSKSVMGGCHFLGRSWRPGLKKILFHPVWVMTPEGGRGLSLLQSLLISLSIQNNVRAGLWFQSKWLHSPRCGWVTFPRHQINPKDSRCKGGVNSLCPSELSLQPICRLSKSSWAGPADKNSASLRWGLFKNDTRQTFNFKKLELYFWNPRMCTEFKKPKAIMFYCSFDKIYI